LVHIAELQSQIAFKYVAYSYIASELIEKADPAVTANVPLTIEEQLTVKRQDPSA
jgi:hypothetical protein